jgi:hypothetical protein
MMGKVQKPSTSKCYMPSAEFFGTCQQNYSRKGKAIPVTGHGGYRVMICRGSHIV